jgi:hypothetical protein
MNKQAGEIAGFDCNYGGDLTTWQQDYLATTASQGALLLHDPDALAYAKWQENFVAGVWLPHDDSGWNPANGALFALGIRNPDGSTISTWKGLQAASGLNSYQDNSGPAIGWGANAALYNATRDQQPKDALDAITAHGRTDQNGYDKWYSWVWGSSAFISFRIAPLPAAPGPTPAAGTTPAASTATGATPPPPATAAPPAPAPAKPTPPAPAKEKTYTCSIAPFSAKPGSQQLKVTCQ